METKLIATPRAGLAGRLALVPPRGWRHFLGQVALLGSFTFIYALTGLYGRHEAGQAVRNARDLQRFERTIGIGWEHTLQRAVLHGPQIAQEIANYTYFNCQFTGSILFLLWVYWRRQRHFARVRDALLAANAVQIVGLFLFPLVPPRAVPGAGYVDTLNADAVNFHSGFIDALNNPSSAMPSLHASYAIVIGAAGVLLTRRLWARVLWALYPALVTYSVLATGNHFLLDVIGGALALLTTPLAWRLSDRLTTTRTCPARATNPHSSSQRARAA